MIPDPTGEPTYAIRHERPGDADAIRAINDAAFDGPVESGIVDGIRGTDRWIDGGSLVAERPNGELVGHLLLSVGDLDGPDGSVTPIWMVGPVAVLPEWQRLGIGAALMEAAIAFATDHDQPVLVLLGHASYYPRFGFVPARSLGIAPPRPWADANWMALPLPAWRDELTGVARFAPSFPDD
jgi:predicted N-acetyltransferase YhbS